MTTRCGLCGAYQPLIRGVLACRRCDRADTWPTATAAVAARTSREDVDLDDPRESGDPR
jgi:hypothetical protein